jgi:hypothetical protein
MSFLLKGWDHVRLKLAFSKCRKNDDDLFLCGINIVDDKKSGIMHVTVVFPSRHSAA